MTAAAAPAHRADQPGHLDFLGDTVTPPAQAGHTHLPAGTEPAVGVLWTYADRATTGSYHRVGGGAYDAATNTYGQGAFNADDIARAAVVYLRHWRQTGDAATAGTQAYQLLRGLTYLQTATGPNAGNVVLWMQPDGTLNPSACRRSTPDPSDSGAVVLAGPHDLGARRGLRRFRDADPAFAGVPAAAAWTWRSRALDRRGADPLRPATRWSTACGCPRG